MKKTTTLILIMALTILTLSTNVFAVDIAKLNAKPDKTTIKAGETLNVVLSLSDYDTNQNALAIRGLTLKIEYDSNVFEEVTQNDISSNLLAVYNDNDQNHELTIASTSAIEANKDIATITFRAKSNIVSTSTTIKFKDATINENKITDTPVTISIGADDIPAATATLSKIEVTKKPTKRAYKIGEKFDPTGMEITATYSDKTTKVVTGYTYEPMGELKEEDKKVTITYKEGLVTKTVDEKIYVNETGELPDTGLENYTLVIIAILGVAIVSFIKLKKYNRV